MIKNCLLESGSPCITLWSWAPLDSFPAFCHLSTTKGTFPFSRVLLDWLVINDQKLSNWVWPTLYVGFEVLTAVVMNVAIFCDIAPCRPYVPSHLLHAGFLLSSFSTLKMEVIRSSETLVHIWTSRRYIQQDGNINYGNKTKLNYVAWVRERTIPIERPQLVGEVIANFLRIEYATCQRDGSLQPYSRISRPELW
jgi:hypothetical protein